jgi:tetratricopeptide (TPR) repeat protein
MSALAYGALHEPKTTRAMADALTKEDGLPAAQEMFVSEDDPKQGHETGKVFILIRDENGFYKVLHVDPRSPYGQAVITGDYKRAAQISKEQLAEDPENTDLLFDAAFALGNAGRHEEALEYYKQLLALDPDNAAAWNNMGCELCSLGREGEAHDAFKRAYNLDPNDFIHAQNLANSYCRRGNMNAYFQYLEKAMNTTSSDIDARVARYNFEKTSGLSCASGVRALHAKLHTSGQEGASALNFH